MEGIQAKITIDTGGLDKSRISCTHDEICDNLTHALKPMRKLLTLHPDGSTTPPLPMKARVVFQDAHTNLWRGVHRKLTCGRLNHGDEVTVVDFAFDAHNRLWLHVARIFASGWALAEFFEVVQ